MTHRGGGLLRNARPVAMVAAFGTLLPNETADANQRQAQSPLKLTLSCQNPASNKAEVHVDDTSAAKRPCLGRSKGIL